MNKKSFKEDILKIIKKYGPKFKINKLKYFNLKNCN